MPPTAPIDHNLEFLAILGLVQPVTVEDVKAAYLEKAKTAHPDRGGDPHEFIRLQQAFEQATEYAQFKAGRMQWLTRWVEQYAEQQQVIDQVKSLGGTVEVKASDWLTQSIGQDFATVLDRVSSIRLSGRAIDDQVMSSLASQRRILAGLRKLELVDTSVTARGLVQFEQFDTLEHLDLSGTRVGAAAVGRMVRALPKLETLIVRKAGIGWWARTKLRWAHRGLQVIA